MSAATTTHRLPLKLGRVFRVDVTETPDTVFIHYGGDKPRCSDVPAVAKFLWPILHAYAEDDRVLEIDGAHNVGPARRIHTLGRTAEQVFISVSAVPRPRMQA